MSEGMHTTEEIFYRIIFTTIRYDYNIPCIAIDSPPVVEELVKSVTMPGHMSMWPVYMVNSDMGHPYPIFTLHHARIKVV